MKILLKVQR